MERAAASRTRPGRGAAAVDAHGQTHQCGIPERGLDPAGQHHDAGAHQCAGDPVSTGGRRRAAAGRGRSTRRRRSTHRGTVTCGGGSQKAAAGAETHTGSTSPAFASAGCAGSTDGVIHSRGACQRMIVFKRRVAR